MTRNTKKDDLYCWGNDQRSKLIRVTKQEILFLDIK